MITLSHLNSNIEIHKLTFKNKVVNKYKKFKF